MSENSVPYRRMLWHCFLKYKLARDMTNSRQQLLWRKQVTVIGFIDIGSQLKEYDTGVAQFEFRHVVCHRRSVCEDSVLLRCCRSLLQQSVILLFFGVANSFLSLNQMITSFSNCFEQLSLAWQFASISSPAGVSLNTSNQDHSEKNDPYDTRLCYLMC